MQPAIIAYLRDGRCAGGAIAVVARIVDKFVPLHVSGRFSTVPRRVGSTPEAEGTHRVEIVVPAQVEIAAVSPVVAMGGVGLHGGSVALRSEQGGAARLVAPCVAVVVFGIKIDGELLVAIDDIDHGAAAAVAGGGVGDDLDAGDAVGREGLDVLSQALAAEVGGSVVNPNFNTLRATQGDITFGVHLHPRGVLQGVAGGAGLHAGVVSSVVDILLAVDCIKRSVGGNLHLFKCLDRRREVEIGVGNGGGGVLRNPYSVVDLGVAYACYCHQ